MNELCSVKSCFTEPKRNRNKSAKSCENSIPDYSILSLPRIYFINIANPGAPS